LFQQVFHVFKILHVAALVTGNGNALRVFFNSGFYNFLNAAVMPQVDDLGSLLLQDTAHDIDGGVVSVKETGRGYYADGVVRVMVLVIVHLVVASAGCGAKLTKNE